ncbi:low temperature requirement protein A [Micromonospora avicenniae]|uniref:Low temperature requirement protein LtrA n=1 Tax=Micromonospora avicenniae TaxID=1198245 RepID=A0A1N6VAH9_9ACTN|nr:low temperature requirement protein A [Micromonospora avicenniae]SIQ74864.1 Low temperature requirement protein LtrA [Micromonospora avicenniae]
MTTVAESDAGSADDSGRPLFVELFLDLVYVFALVSLTKTLAGDLSWTGVARTLVLLFAFALIWALTTWVGGTSGLDRPSVEAHIIGVAAASLLMAAAAPDAFGDRGLLFAATYLLIHAGSISYYQFLSRDPAGPRRTARIAFWEAIAAVGWVAGALLEGPARLGLWALATAVEYTAAVFGWPVPKLGRSQAMEWQLGGERVPERYRQFVVVALGVSILTTGTTFSQHEYTLNRGFALAVVFTIVVLMWRIYIYRAGELLTEAIARSSDPALLTRAAAVCHLAMVAGIVGVAVASDLVVVRPLGDTPPSWAAVLLGSPALFLIGRGLLDYTVFGRVSRSRVVGLVLLAGAAPASSVLPPVIVALLAVVVLALIAAANLVATRLHPRTAAPPALG